MTNVCLAFGVEWLAAVRAYAAFLLLDVFSVGSGSCGKCQ